MLPYDGPLLHAFIHVPSNAVNILPHLDLPPPKGYVLPQFARKMY